MTSSGGAKCVFKGRRSTRTALSPGSLRTAAATRCRRSERLPRAGTSTNTRDPLGSLHPAPTASGYSDEVLASTAEATASISEAPSSSMSASP